MLDETITSPSTTDKSQLQPHPRAQSIVRTALYAVSALSVMALCITIGANHKIVGDALKSISAVETATAQEAFPAPAQSETLVEKTAQTSAANASSASEVVSPFLASIRGGEVTQCAQIVPAFGEMLTVGSDYGAKSIWNPNAPDANPIYALVGMDYADESVSSSGAGFLYAAPNANGCQGAMVRVVPVAQPCSAIPRMLPEGSTVSDKLNSVQTYALGDEGTSMLIPANGSCVVVTIATATSIYTPSEASSTQ